MKPKGGRTSAAAQEVAVLGHMEQISRPDAPYDLTDEQSQEWWAVVNRMPADWFPRETHGMLAQYCRLIVRARRLAMLINEMEAGKNLDLTTYRDLIRSEQQVSNTICSLATKMRLSQQSTWDRTRRKQPITLEKPWLSNAEQEDDDE